MKRGNAKNKLRDAQSPFLFDVKTFANLCLGDRASMKFHAFCQCREWRSIRRRFRGQISPFFANARRVRIHREK